MQKMKETAANIGASAKSGLEKTKAVVQEKKERMTAHDPTEKEMAAERKEERMRQAELDKQEARQHNVASRQAATTVPGGHGRNYTAGAGGAGTTATYSTATGEYGHPTAGQQTSAMPPGHGTGQPFGGYVVDEGRRSDTQHGGNDNAHGYGTARPARSGRHYMN